MVKHSRSLFAFAIVAVTATTLGLLIRNAHAQATIASDAPLARNIDPARARPVSAPPRVLPESGYTWGPREATSRTYGIVEAIRDARSREAFANLKEQLKLDLPTNSFILSGASFATVPVGSVRAFVRVKFSGNELVNTTSHTHDPQDEAISYDDDIFDDPNDDDDDDDDGDDDFDDDDDDYIRRGRRERRRVRGRGRVRNPRRSRGIFGPNAPPSQCEACVYKGLKDRILQVVNELKLYGSGLKTRPNMTHFNETIRFTRNLRLRVVNDTIVGRGAVGFSGTISEVMAALERICTNKYVYLKGLIMLPDTATLTQDLHDRLKNNAKTLAEENAKVLFKQFGYTKALNMTQMYDPIYKLSVTGSPTVVSREWFYGLNNAKAPSADSTNDLISILNLNTLIQARVRGLFAPVENK